MKRFQDLKRFEMFYLRSLVKPGTFTGYVKMNETDAKRHPDPEGSGLHEMAPDQMCFTKEELMYPNQGKSWTSDLTDQLLIGFDAGHDLETLCKLCGRTPSAIVSKLHFMGRLHMDNRLRYFKVDVDPWTSYQEIKALNPELKGK